MLAFDLTRYWWLWLLRGVLAVAFGILALAVPAIALNVLIAFFGAYLFVNGIFCVSASFSYRSLSDRSWYLGFEGAIGIMVGLIALFSPRITALTIIVLIASWAMVSGAFMILWAIWLRREVQDEWRLALSGLLSLAWGLLMIMWPGAGLIAWTWIVGACTFAVGGLLIALSLVLRRLHLDIGRGLHSGRIT